MTKTADPRRTKALGRLMLWTHDPRPVRDIQKILEDCTDGDLLAALETFSKNTAAGRIAWAEYGRRKGYIDFELKITEGEGQLHLDFEGAAKPLHETPIVDLKDDG